MKILLIGSGGREHALAWALSASDLCDNLYCAPGNAGIAQIAQCIDLDGEDVENITHWTVDNKIDFVIIGPEAPLVAGLSDALRKRDIPVFGPSQAAAILEGSKGFVKDLCAEYNIPTASYGRFTNLEEATAFIRKQSIPVVIKADGLAAGKGVIIAQSHDEAINTAQDMLSGNSFGQSGHSIVVEEFLEGEEISYFALTDGKDILPLVSAQDHKRAFDGDKGPNTGGMGAYSPARLMTPELEQEIIDTILKPTVKAMNDKDRTYNGVLFAGLMVKDGKPYLIEYNARFGDPECQCLMMRFQGDLAATLYACAQGKLASAADQIAWSNLVSLCVIMASQGYPGPYKKGTEIKNLDQAGHATDETTIFHAGTKQEGDKILATGGRVLCITSRGTDVKEARDRAYETVKAIDWPEGFYRTDIAWRALED